MTMKESKRRICQHANENVMRDMSHAEKKFRRKTKEKRERERERETERDRLMYTRM
jgi:hypothetical protein